MKKMETKPDIFNPDCPSRELLEFIGGKWCLLILCALHTKKKKRMRTGELRRTVGGVSQKMLTQTLREMEFNGIILRISYPGVPPHVEYELTELGLELRKLVVSIEQWMERRFTDLMAARKANRLLRPA
jgi:DNA-binding HxlR family transcriptional regulator